MCHRCRSQPPRSRSYPARRARAWAGCGGPRSPRMSRSITMPPIAFPTSTSTAARTSRRALGEEPDFLFVSPQLQPRRPAPEHPRHADAPDPGDLRCGERADAPDWPTRPRAGTSCQAARREAERGRAGSRKANLDCYDGVIAVSELDKQIFVDEFGIPAQAFWSSRTASIRTISRSHNDSLDDRKAILFVGSLGYAPQPAGARGSWA